MSKTTTQIVTQEESQNVTLGEQLTAKYREAIGGMRAVLIFGAMMLWLEKSFDSARGVEKHKGSGQYVKGSGLKGWLATYAPEVKEATAYRFKALAEGVRDECAIGKKADLVRILTRDPSELEAKEAKKQREIFDFIEGKSQRQLLFYFAKEDPKNPGGKKTAGDEPSDDPEVVAYDMITTRVVALAESWEKHWPHLSDKDKKLIYPVLNRMRTELGKALGEIK